MEIIAYAKVNLILNVYGTLPNGYHEVGSFMQGISLFDKVRVDCKASNSFNIHLNPGSKDLPKDERNLAYRAALLMHEFFHKDIEEEIFIDIEKNIPIAAGLAGGSSNAAGVITALKRLWNIEDEEKLLSIAAKLGADVPFSYWLCNKNFAALAEGTGTKLEETLPIKCKMLLYTPEFLVSTKLVYQSMNEADYSKNKENLSYFCKEKNLNKKVLYMKNDMQNAAFRLFPKIGEAFTLLKNLAPSSLAIQLSGSGPSVFAILSEDFKPDEKFLSSLKEKKVLLVETMTK